MQTHGSGTVREAAPAGGSFARKRSGTEDIMKIGEAQQIYREQVKAYQEQKHVLSERLKQVQERQEARTPRFWSCRSGRLMRNRRSTVTI